MPTTHRQFEFDWLGYSTIRIRTPDHTVLYLDPGRCDYGVLTDSCPGDADFVLVSHTHHYDPDAIARVATSETTIYVFDDILDLNNTTPLREKADITAPHDLEYDVIPFEYEAEFAVDGIHVLTLPAYNLPSPEGLRITPAGDPIQPPGTCVGFHLTSGDTTLLWPSDSDFVPEHQDLDVDVLFAPIGGAYTMDRLEAAELVETLQPDLVIPVHYNSLFEIAADPDAFKTDVEALGVRCDVL